MAMLEIYLRNKFLEDYTSIPPLTTAHAFVKSVSMCTKSVSCMWILRNGNIAGFQFSLIGKQIRGRSNNKYVTQKQPIFGDLPTYYIIDLQSESNGIDWPTYLESVTYHSNVLLEYYQQVLKLATHKFFCIPSMLRVRWRHIVWMSGVGWPHGLSGTDRCAPSKTSGAPRIPPPPS